MVGVTDAAALGAAGINRYINLQESSQVLTGLSYHRASQIDTQQKSPGDALLRNV